MHVIAIANQKGGVAKTTTTMNLGAALAEMAYNVLLIDMDPQSSLTRLFGYEPTQSPSIYDAMRVVAQDGEHPPINLTAIEEKTEIGVDLWPSSLSLSSAEGEFSSIYGAEFLLKELIDQIQPGKYDFVLIDCPPALGILTGNALAAAHSVLIPVASEAMALHGIGIFMPTIAKIKKRVNRSLQVMGILLTMSDLRTKHAKTVNKVVELELGDNYRILGPIRQDVRLREATLVNQSIFQYAANSSGAHGYRQLATNISGIVHG